MNIKQSSMAAAQEVEDFHEIHGHEVIEKPVKAAGTGAIVYVPKRWRGERVKIVRITDNQTED